ncbi:MAG: hypothetical protein H6531_03445 [Actinobacteria bacterium]|nr:hypothetical protein [Thermoleophilia bacterium]MCB9010871.1 hypothetical protein [Actinomycetota bacterium]
MIPRKYRRVLATGLVGASLVIAGCGGGGGDSATLSADEFRTQADAICKQAEDALDALGSPSSEAEFPGFFKQATELNRDQLAKLEDLSPPEELKSDYDEALGLLREQQKLYEDANTRVAGGENALTVIQSLDSKVRDLTDQAEQKASELGLRECGNGSSSGSSTTDATTTADDTTTAEVTTTAATDTPGAEVGIEVFVADVQSYAQTLTQLGLTMQAAGSGSAALEKRAPLMRQQLDEFDAKTAKMAGYTVSVESLEVKRAAIVEASPDISRLGRELIDAAEAGDGSKAQSVAAEMQTALQRLKDAANK